jgi:hypothetical protein
MKHAHDHKKKICFEKIFHHKDHKYSLACQKQCHGIKVQQFHLRITLPVLDANWEVDDLYHGHDKPNVTVVVVIFQMHGDKFGIWNNRGIDRHDLSAWFHNLPGSTLLGLTPYHAQPFWISTLLVWSFTGPNLHGLNVLSAPISSIVWARTCGLDPIPNPWDFLLSPGSVLGAPHLSPHANLSALRLVLAFYARYIFSLT